MQGVKTYSAAHWVEKWSRKYVVEIHGHGSQQDQPVSFPVLLIVKPGNSTYGYKMKKIMSESLQLQVL